MDFYRYIEVFNSGDDDVLVNDWFTDDIVYIGSNRKIEGKAAWRDFLKFAHNGVREIFRPQDLFQKEDAFFCEIDMDFHATKPRPEFPLGPMFPGDMMTVKFFVIYKVRDNKFCRLKSATWPKNHGISRIPRLGGATQGKRRRSSPILPPSRRVIMIDPAHSTPTMWFWSWPVPSRYAAGKRYSPITGGFSTGSTRICKSPLSRRPMT